MWPNAPRSELKQLTAERSATMLHVAVTSPSNPHPEFEMLDRELQQLVWWLRSRETAHLVETDLEKKRVRLATRLMSRHQNPNCL